MEIDCGRVKQTLVLIGVAICAFAAGWYLRDRKPSRIDSLKCQQAIDAIEMAWPGIATDKLPLRMQYELKEDCGELPGH